MLGLSSFFGAIDSGTYASVTGFSGTSSNGAYEWGTVTGGNLYLSDLTGAPGGSNVFSSGALFQISVPSFQVGRNYGTGAINLFAKNMVNDYDYKDNVNLPASGASASISSIGYTSDAIALTGNVNIYNGASNLNPKIVVQQSTSGGTTDFVFKPNPTGYWQFFAMLGSQDTVTYTINSPLGTQTQSYTFPSSGTQSTATYGAYLTAPRVSLDAGQVTGQVTDASNGAGISGARVTLSDSSGSVSTSTNQFGGYAIYFPVTGTYSMSASATGYYSSSVSDLSFTINNTYGEQFALSPESSGGGGSGGGGGCVLYGTLIAMANGTFLPVQDLQPGMEILSYDTATGQYFNSTLTKSEVTTNVSQLWEIDGIVNISGVNKQPVYVQLQNGSDEWVVLGQLNFTMKIYDALDNTWMPIYSIIIRIGNWTVYEPENAPFVHTDQTLRGTYIANGVVLDLLIKS